MQVHIRDGSDKVYEFDGVLSSDCSQKEVYRQAVRPLVHAVVRGSNATVLAYGQTGSGKTYTMGTGAHQQVTDCQQESTNRQFTFKCSHLKSSTY